MKTHIEKHTYAPELNRAHLMKHGRVLRDLAAPGCVGRADVLRFYRWHPLKSGVYARVKVEYPEPFASLSRMYQGYTPSRADALAFKRELHKRHHGGPLMDGRVLPDPRITIAFQVVG